MFEQRPRWFVWWYAAIAAGFFLLAITQAILGRTVWQVALEFLISAGFGALSYAENKSQGRG
jgi:hypothetical protein